MGRRPCKDSSKGRHKHAGPYAASFAALVPLRAYPSDKQKRLKVVCLHRNLARPPPHAGRSGTGRPAGIIGAQESLEPPTPHFKTSNNLRLIPFSLSSIIKYQHPT